MYICTFTHICMHIFVMHVPPRLPHKPFIFDNLFAKWGRHRLLNICVLDEMSVSFVKEPCTNRAFLIQYYFTKMTWHLIGHTNGSDPMLHPQILMGSISERGQQMQKKVCARRNRMTLTNASSWRSQPPSTSFRADCRLRCEHFRMLASISATHAGTQRILSAQEKNTEKKHSPTQRYKY